MSRPPGVTVVGGGIAGLAAALRLAERGYPVKVYERSDRLGGNLSSRTIDGRQLDVYPHMYLNWYHNLWALLRDATGQEPHAGFKRCSTIWQLRRHEYPRFRGISNAYSPWNPRNVVANLLSGIAPPADMFLFGYGSSDLLAQGFRQTEAVDELSVSAFLHSRPYMTDRAAEAYNNFITLVWSLPSYLTSAADYQRYLSHCVAEPTPAFWLPRGSAQERVIGPLVAALERAGAEIVKGVQLLDVACRGGRARRLTLQRVRLDGLGGFVGEGDEWKEDVQELVLAITAPELARVVSAGAPGERIVESMPQASELTRLDALPIPILHVYFNHRLPKLPAEPVGLLGSQLALAFTDISQTWEGMGDRTVLALSCSDPHGLPGTGWRDNAMTMLRELGDYLRFNVGGGWGASPQIDWKRTHYDANADAQLFVNEIGTDTWRPGARCDELSNVSFAGDFCRNRVGMTTIESAATAGVQAAAEIVARHHIGAEVEVHEPRSLPAALHASLRLAWAPYAAYAKMWSRGGDAVRSMGGRLRDRVR